MFKSPLIHDVTDNSLRSLQEIIKQVLISNLVYNLLNLIIIFTVFIQWKCQRNHPNISATSAISGRISFVTI